MVVQEQNKFENQLLLNIPQLMEYTGFGETKIRKLLNSRKSTFTIKNGNRLYAHKKLFDEYLEKCAKYNLQL